MILDRGSITVIVSLMEVLQIVRFEGIRASIFGDKSLVIYRSAGHISKPRHRTCLSPSWITIAMINTNKIGFNKFFDKI